MKTIKNFEKLAVVAMLLAGVSDVDALSYNDGTKVSSSSASVTEGVATITIGLKVEEVSSITSATYTSQAPKADGTYDAGKVGQIDIVYSTNTPGTIKLTPTSSTFTRNGNSSTVSYHFVNGGTSSTAGEAFQSSTLSDPGNDLNYSVDVHADSNITLGGVYTDTVRIEFVPDSVA